MSFALIAHRKSANTNGGALGAASNTFYPTPLTDLLVNDGGTTVLNFRQSGGIGGSQFDLSPGIYRVSADISIVEFDGGGFQTISCASTIGLYNVSAGRFEYHRSSTAPIIACSPICGGAVNVREMASVINLQGEFIVTGTLATYEIRQAIVDVFDGSITPTDGDTLGEQALVTAGGYDEYYNMVKINRLSA